MIISGEETTMNIYLRIHMYNGLRSDNELLIAYTWTALDVIITEDADVPFC